MKKTLKQQFDEIHLSSRKFDDKVCDITMDGCGSFCSPEFCEAKKEGVCRGCTKCDNFNNCPEGGCDSCHVRCGRRNDIDKWIRDVDGLSIDDVSCSNVFNGELPFFSPQVRESAVGLEHGAYLVSFSRFLRILDGDVKWLYRKRKTIREAYGISDATKLILHFYAKDDLLELIWRFQDKDWADGKNIWEIFAGYGFDAAISVNYSCFANQPRMEHVLNVKRNILSARSLSDAGIPVVLDLMWHSDTDFDRLLDWGKANNVKWYALNFQTLRRGNWALPLILELLEKVFRANPEAKVIANGVSEERRVKAIVKKFGSKVVVSNFSAYMKSVYTGLVYDEENKKWVKTDMDKAARWKKTVEMYSSWGRQNE